MILRLFIIPLLLLSTVSCSHHNAAVADVKNTKFQPNLVIIDPGHGGHNYGTQSKNGKYIEKNLNLATAYMLQNHLNKMGIKTLMTRKNDTFISLGKRAEIANNARAALFVSIHYNWASTSRANGIEVFYYRHSRAGKSLAKNTLEAMKRTTGEYSRGIKPANFTVLRKTDMPAILVEGGFLSNHHDLELLKDPKYLNKVALGIAEGVKKYLN